MCSSRCATLLLLMTAHMIACAGRTRAPVAGTNSISSAPSANVGLGQCGDPGMVGVLSAQPNIKRADLDLNDDGVAEPVVADRGLCTKQGNCHWNIFVRDKATGCHRYVGTVAAAGLQRSPQRGDDGFVDLRGWWDFGAGGRLLLQHYRFRRGAYHILETLICRRQDGRVFCADERKADPS